MTPIYPCEFETEDGDTFAMNLDPLLIPLSGSVSLFKNEQVLLSKGGRLLYVDASGLSRDVDANAFDFPQCNSLSSGES